QANHPVVGVSWYEAVAFCLWLSKVSGERIMLPTEPQWQRAAQVLPDGRNIRYIYPWGNEWNGSKCNNNVAPFNSKSTTPVLQYAGQGDSPCGVTDMAGNVWEWCRTEYYSGMDDLNGTNARVLRGGSWLNPDPDFFRTLNRSWFFPNDGGSFRGFRLALL
ncbi:MAG: formylglycine-generating enzyme family protein, partial [Anaerolineae bacterium]|nr:formylglycine-generating enzyme family protein [Anaerolineae bacterium]